MKIGVIGSGSVGQALARGFASKGHDVVLGIRSVTATELAKPRQMAATLADWQAETGLRVVTMAAAAAHGEVVVNATAGVASLAALTLAGEENLAGKILIDVANPLDFSRGMPPFLATEYAGPTSLGEQIQAAHPTARVVKAFNTVSNAAMVDASYVPGDHDLMIAGNDPSAKAIVTDLARGFGWKSVVDLGDIIGARASESLLPFWVRMWMLGGDPRVNIRLVRPSN